VSEPGRAEPSRAGISHYSPLPLLARQPSRLLAGDFILVLAVLCSPPCVIMLHQSEKQHAEDGEKGGRRGEERGKGAELVCASVTLRGVVLAC